MCEVRGKVLVCGMWGRVFEGEVMGKHLGGGVRGVM